MHSVAFFNNKGGVGKTTLLCNVAAYLALRKKKKVLVIDCDPQCNATQLMLTDEEVLDLYDDRSSFTVHSVIHPLSIGKGYAERISPRKVSSYGLHLIPGDPRLALKEDLLSKDWQAAVSGEVRGLRTSYLFAELLDRCKEYDFVFFDVGPSLGSINRAVLLSCEFFVSPMSIDIFSVRAIENISIALTEWRKMLNIGLQLVDEELVDDLPHRNEFDIEFAGFVAQSYTQKTVRGEKRAVAAYDKIKKKIPKIIKKEFVDKLHSDNKLLNYEIGSIPNLHSLIPMSQTAHKPIFNLRSSDGVRGAHFNRVRDADEIYSHISENLLSNIAALSCD